MVLVGGGDKQPTANNGSVHPTAWSAGTTNKRPEKKSKKTKTLSPASSPASSAVPPRTTRTTRSSRGQDRSSNESWWVNTDKGVGATHTQVLVADGTETINITRIGYIEKTYQANTPAFTVSDSPLLPPDKCLEWSNVLEEFVGRTDFGMLQYTNGRTFFPLVPPSQEEDSPLADRLRRISKDVEALLESSVFQRAEKLLVAPFYPKNKRYTIESVSCFFVQEKKDDTIDTNKNTIHTDITLRKNGPKGTDEGCVALHIPVTETSEDLGGSAWFINGNNKKNEPLAKVWGRMGCPYALNASQWHDGFGDRSSTRKVLAVRYLPVYSDKKLAMIVRASFEYHFPGRLRWTGKGSRMSTIRIYHHPLEVDDEGAITKRKPNFWNKEDETRYAITIRARDVQGDRIGNGVLELAKEQAQSEKECLVFSSPIKKCIIRGEGVPTAHTYDDFCQMPVDKILGCGTEETKTVHVGVFF